MFYDFFLMFLMMLDEVFMMFDDVLMMFFDV